MKASLLLTSLLILVAGCAEPAPDHGFILRGGTLIDGTGAPPLRADVAIDGDRISEIGDLSQERAHTEIDVSGLAVAPGFINMLSWSNESLLQDGRSLSDIYQGVTLELMGEGTSMGPLNEAMKQEKLEKQIDIAYDVSWSSLGGYLQRLEEQGISTNVASLVGAATVRQYVLGYEDRQADPDEMEQMKQLVREAMQEGAMGLGSSLPYVPGNFASTEELIELAGVAAEFDGLFTSHIRSEGKRALESLDEFLTIVRESGVRGEIYHLKVSGQENWHKLEEVIRVIESAREEGLPVTADMYTYHASSTGLSYVLPSWVKEGGHDVLVERLQDPAIREKLPAEMDMIPPEDIVLSSFRQESLRSLIGKTLAEVAEERGTTPEVTVMDLIVEDDSRIGTVRFTMKEEHVPLKIALPWVSFCSDSASQAPEHPFTNSQPHPRAYGSFARLLGKFVREQGIISLEEAVHRLSGLPAANLKRDRRGLLAPGYFADVVVFDPAEVADVATFEAPHQLARGMVHVFVNGGQVLRDGEHTGATPGRFVKGPGSKEGSLR